MIYRIGIKGKLITLFSYLFSMALVLDCYSIWYNLRSTPSYLNVLTSLLILFLCAALILIKGSISRKRLEKAVIVFLIFLLYVLLPLIVNPLNYFSRSFLAIGIIIIFSSIYCSGKEFLDILVKYRNLVMLIAVVSLFFWFFGSIMNWIQPSGFVYTTWAGKNAKYKEVSVYYGIYYNTQQIDFLGKSICRNTSIFVEAPMASFHFSLALLIEKFFAKDKKIGRQILLIIAIISTFSVTGIIVILISVIGEYYLYYKNNKSHNKVFIFLGLFVITFFLLLCVFAAIQAQILRYQSLYNDSYSSFSNIRYYIEIWSKKPIFGYGFGDLTSILPSSNVEIRDNSLFMILSHGGIYFAALYAFFLIKGIKKSICLHDYKTFVFTIIFFLIVTMTVVYMKYITFFVMLFIINDGHSKTLHKGLSDGREGDL